MAKGRLAILAENGLQFAPRDVQRSFWQRYNARRNRTAMLGDFAALVVSDEGLRASRRLQRVREAWAAVAPADIVECSEVHSLRGGRLRVAVASSAARFVLSRDLNGNLIRSLRAHLAGIRIERVDYFVAGDGAARPGPADGDSECKTGR
jgi:hypothetical protein